MIQRVVRLIKPLKTRQQRPSVSWLSFLWNQVLQRPAVVGKIVSTKRRVSENWRTTWVSVLMIILAAVKVAPTTSLHVKKSRKTARSQRALKFPQLATQVMFLWAVASRVRKPAQIKKRKIMSHLMKFSAPLFIKIAALKLNNLDRLMSLFSQSLTQLGLSIRSSQKGSPSRPLSPSSAKNGPHPVRTYMSLRGIVKVRRRKGHVLSYGRNQIIA